VQIRRATAADIDSMMNLDRGTTTASHWSRRQYEALFTENVEKSSERLALVVADQLHKDQAPDNAHKDQSHNFEAANSESCILAYLVAHRIDAEWELENIVVAEKVRGTGIGLRLVRELVEHARRTGGSSISLEVRESNFAARSLYGKSGFVEIGRRKGYYPHPPEDAIIYRQII
jgi:ribosomal-protein-alanine acetyltransferase